MTAVDEQIALAYYEFVQARHADELREQYPTADSAPAVEAYQERHRAAQEEHQALVDALHRGDEEKATDSLWGLRNQAGAWMEHPDYPEPVSDGTMPCPVPAPDTGHPCTKLIPKGWIAAEGHGGGHFWQAPEVSDLVARGMHYDPVTLLSGQPTLWHLPRDCTPDCWKWRDR
ncbi:hypothetical protein ACIBAC_00165 [Streptomyces sp. NPDC051362]|uniref:hypothetical protein n=1 Tax=Streptomyces sp. NPDC051362 TaxID=3365651 RepID=UPI0037A59886